MFTFDIHLHFMQRKDNYERTGKIPAICGNSYRQRSLYYRYHALYRMSAHSGKAAGRGNGGTLDLSGTQIQTLPDGLTVGGWLDLSGTQIQTLPDGLTVGGWLDLRNTKIQTLPDGLTVGVGLYLSGTQIQTLPGITRHITIIKEK